MSRLSPKICSRLARSLLLSWCGLKQSFTLSEADGGIRVFFSMVSLRSFTAVGTPSSTEEMLAPSVDEKEANKFRKIAAEWWNPNGPLGPLHNFNPARCKFIRDVLCWHHEKDPCRREPLLGLSVLDVGCGGGLLSEPMARMGARVTGIDILEENLEVARLHAADDPVIGPRLQYYNKSAEILEKEGQTFDVVVASEVIEHVKEPQEFLLTLSRLLSDKGTLILSSLNRTFRSYCFAILGAEYVLGMLPKGTHTWTKFLTPEELVIASDAAGLKLAQLSGIVLDPIEGRFSLQQDTSVNYVLAFVNKGSSDVGQVLV